MSAAWHALVWSGGLAMLALPFVPLWREWARPTDSAPLAVAPGAGNDSDFFARQLREEVAATPRSAAAPPRTPAQWAQARETVVVAGRLRLDAPVRCAAPLYVEGSLEAPGGCAFASVMATGDIRLGPDCEVSQWMHADGRIRVAAGSVVLRRATGRSIRLEPGCSFERLRAAQVCFGRGTGRPRMPAPPQAAASDFSSVPRAERRMPGLHRVAGNCVLPAGSHFEGSLVVTGSLWIGEETVIRGDIKARRGVMIGARCAIHGAVTSERTIEIGQGAFIQGPVTAETDVIIGAGAIIAAEDRPTTVSAENIMVESGAVAHGVVWAREAGIVWAGS
jgi:cytoskeletal protein CcmA (bactofilin family)